MIAGAPGEHGEPAMPKPYRRRRGSSVELEGGRSWIDCANQGIGFGGFPPRHVERVTGVPSTRGDSSPAPLFAYADFALAVSNWLRRSLHVDKAWKRFMYLFLLISKFPVYKHD